MRARRILRSPAWHEKGKIKVDKDERKSGLGRQLSGRDHSPHRAGLGFHHPWGHREPQDPTGMGHHERVGGMGRGLLLSLLSEKQESMSHVPSGCRHLGFLIWMVATNISFGRPVGNKCVKVLDICFELAI